MNILITFVFVGILLVSNIFLPFVARDSKTKSTPTPNPVSTQIVYPTPTVTPLPTITPTFTPTPSPTNTPLPTVTINPTVEFTNSIKGTAGHILYQDPIPTTPEGWQSFERGYFYAFSKDSQYCKLSLFYKNGEELNPINNVTDFSDIYLQIEYFGYNGEKASVKSLSKGKIYAELTPMTSTKVFIRYNFSLQYELDNLHVLTESGIDVCYSYEIYKAVG